MKKMLPYLGASLTLLAACWATSVKAQDASFKDVPSDHWAYQAVTDLQSKGVITGYPDGYFRGKRTLTRYEFAIALYRALSKITGTPGPKGDAGEAGPAGPAGPPGMTPDEVKELQALTQEFKNDLTSLGASVKDIQSRLDTLSRDVADIKDYLNRMPKFSGDFFGGFRSNLSRGYFLDYSGAPQGPNRSLAENVDAIHDFHLGVMANLPYNVKLNADLVTSNYLSYRGSGLSGTFLGGPSAANSNGGPQQTTLYTANLAIPIGSFGSNTQLILGRFKNQVTPLTYYRPDTDAYFNLPWYDDGNWVQDGFKLESKFGSATTQLFAGSYTSLTSTTGGATINAPLVGATFAPRQVAAGFQRLGKPFGLNYPQEGQLIAGQSAGVHVGVPLFKYGEIGVTAIDFGGVNSKPLANTLGLGGSPFTNVAVYGADVKLKPFGRIAVSAEVAKSVTQRDISHGDGQSNDDNNAATANVGYASGPIAAQVGYLYIDPRFAAPGYWDKLGNWYNPTNIQGPFARVNYKFTDVLSGYLGGDYYTGARNRPLAFTTGSSIGRGVAGVKFLLNKKVTLNADYEGVFYSLSAAATGNGGRAKPVEQYITVGAGLNLNPNTLVKFGYQILSLQGTRNLQGFGTSSDYNANVLTTQVAVHF